MSVQTKYRLSQASALLGLALLVLAAWMAMVAL